MIQKRQLLDSTNLNNAFLSKSQTTDQSIGSNLFIDGGILRLKNSLFTDSASSSYLRIDPQGNKIIVYDGVSNQTVDIYSSSGSEYLSLSTINSTTSYAQIDAVGVGVDHLKINSGGKPTKLGGALFFEGSPYLQSDSDFYFLKNNSGIAQRIATGGVLASSSYADLSKVPTLGIYSVGNIETAGTLVAKGNSLHFTGEAHNDEKVNLYQGSGGNRYQLGTEAYQMKYGGGGTSTDSTGHKFMRGGNELIAQIGYGGAGTPANRLDSYFAGNVNVNGALTAPSLSLTTDISFTDVSGYWLKTASTWGLYWDTATNILHYHGAGTSRFSVDLDNGATVVGNTLNVSSTTTTAGLTISSGLLTHTATDSYDKIRVWTSGSYTIGMKSGQSYGYLSDYAMTFTMNNAVNRGFLWRDESDLSTDGAMSLTTDGRLYVKDVANVGSLYSRGTVDGGALYARNTIGSVSIPSGGEIVSRYNGTAVVRDHGNGNITMSATGGLLYLGYTTTTGVRVETKLDLNANASARLILPVGTNKYAT